MELPSDVGEPGQREYKSCNNWEFVLEIAVVENRLNITASHLEDNTIQYSSDFTEGDLKGMGLKKCENLEKIQRMLHQAHDGLNEDSNLAYCLDRSKNNNTKAAELLILRLQLDSVIGELDFDFNLRRVDFSGDACWQRQRTQLLDRVQHLEYEVRYLKKEMSRLSLIVERLEEEKVENESVIFDGQSESRFVRVERRRERHRKSNCRKNRRRGAVQLDHPVEPPPADNFDSFSEYDYQNRRRGSKNSYASFNSLPASVCLLNMGHDV